MKVNPIIKENFDQLVLLCTKYRVNRMYAFGSVVSGSFDSESSDLDLIVELEKMPPLEKGESLLSLWSELEDLFGREVDMLTDKPIKNPYLRKAIEDTKKLIYDREGEEILV